MLRRCLLPVLLLCAVLAPAAHAARQQEATFQDDNRLVYAKSVGEAAKTLDTLKALGVDRLRISVFWRLVAPAPDSPTKPAGFDATDPAAYPPNAWSRYDVLVLLARQRGMDVNFNVTSPAPNWATGTPARKDIDETYAPDAAEFGAFMTALGRRYSGTYYPPGQTIPIPRVNYWSIWNEPNQPGWLTPQWRTDPRNPKAFIEAAPFIYRTLVDAAWSALTTTGHERDTILVGETAPKGQKTVRGETRAITALRFIRQLYCLDDTLQLLKGEDARLRGCPTSDQVPQFVAAHPGLFRMTGYAHHPYELSFSPSTKPEFPEYVTIANLEALQRTLRRVFQRYGQPLPGNAKSGMPLYLTEFGYQTPPDPLGVSAAKQAAYINQSEYIAWRNPTVKTLAQFLLGDDGGDPALTFQSGLQTLAGKRKPAYAAYEMPIWLSQRKVRRGGRIPVWGGVRRAPAGPRQTVVIEERDTRRGAKWRKLGTARTDGLRGYFTAKVRIRRAGLVRTTWKDAAGRTFHSRAVSVALKR